MPKVTQQVMSGYLDLVLLPDFFPLDPKYCSVKVWRQEEGVAYWGDGQNSRR